MRRYLTRSGRIVMLVNVIFGLIFLTKLSLRISWSMSPISISINNTSEAISNIETNPKFLYQYDGQSESSTKQVNTADGEEDGSKDYRDLLSTTSTSSQPVFKFVPEYEFSCIEYRQQSSQRDVADTETLSLYETTFSRTELDECSHFSYIVPVLILLLKIRAFDGALMGQEITVNQSHLQISSNGESILGDSTVKPAFVFAECLYPKYYAEAAKNQHADSRFFAGEKFPQDYVVNNLALILKEWSMFCSENNVHEWWLSHGNLLGWFWNRKLLPW